MVNKHSLCHSLILSVVLKDFLEELAHFISVDIGLLKNHYFLSLKCEKNMAGILAIRQCFFFFFLLN